VFDLLGLVLDEGSAFLPPAKVFVLPSTQIRKKTVKTFRASRVMNFLRFLMLLALAVWLGGIIFFSAGAAPAVLHSVSDRALGGAIISESLTRLHWMGVVCGAIFLAASLACSRLVRGGYQIFSASKILVA